MEVEGIMIQRILFFLALNGVEIHQRRFVSNSVFTSEFQCRTVHLVFVMQIQSVNCTL